MCVSICLRHTCPLLEGFFDGRGQGNTVSELVLLWERQQRWQLLETAALAEVPPAAVSASSATSINVAASTIQNKDLEVDLANHLPWCFEVGCSPPTLYPDLPPQKNKRRHIQTIPSFWFPQPAPQKKGGADPAKSVPQRPHPAQNN